MKTKTYVTDDDPVAFKLIEWVAIAIMIIASGIGVFIAVSIY